MEQPMDVEGPPEAPQHPSGEDPASMDTVDLFGFDKTSRRSSLGADSVLDQDFSEEGPEADGAPSLTPLETVVGLQYADDIFSNRRAAEVHYHVKNCMVDQPQVTQHMRCTLVHWLIKVSQQLQFGAETVFVAVGLSDRFLATTPLAQDCLQLLALCSLFVAAKMEESVLPRVSELASICGGTYKHHHFRRMEVLLLSKLEFALYVPTSWYFLNHLALKAAQKGTMDRRVLGVARYIAETCLGSYEITQQRASVQAAGAILSALFLLPCPAFYDTLHELLGELYSAREQREARRCASLMTRYMRPFLEPLALLDPVHDQHHEDEAEDDSFQSHDHAHSSFSSSSASSSSSYASSSSSSSCTCYCSYASTSSSSSHAYRSHLFRSHSHDPSISSSHSFFRPQSPSPTRDPSHAHVLSHNPSLSPMSLSKPKDPKGRQGRDCKKRGGGDGDGGVGGGGALI